MRILTFNVNGIRKLRQYRPFYQYKDWKAALDHFESDIICFQETKLTKQSFGADIALVDGYDSYFSIARNTGLGYSGVVTYLKKGIVPLAAEEGLSGRLATSTGNGGRNAVLPHPELDDMTDTEIMTLDSEGRTVILEFNEFILINVYCPHQASADRLEFKKGFLDILYRRIMALHRAGKSVILLGDINIAHKEIDHCDVLKSNRDNCLENYSDHPCRQWFSRLIDPRAGGMVDLFRHFYPTAAKAYTCWNTLTNARPANFGTRIDYILASQGLVDRVSDCQHQTDMQGSDHCPVVADVNIDLIPESAQREPPPLCSKFHKDLKYQGKLLNFLRAVPEKGTTTPEIAFSEKSTTTPEILLPKSDMMSDQDFEKFLQNYAAFASQEDGHAIVQEEVATNNSYSPKETRVQEKHTKGAESSGSKRPAKAQSSLLGFIKSSKMAKEESVQEKDKSIVDAKEEIIQERNTGTFAKEKSITIPDNYQKEATAEKWSKLLTKKPPPLCSLHREPCRQWAVNKAGPNKGRHFYLCSRPVGPSNETLEMQARQLKQEIDAAAGSVDESALAEKVQQRDEILKILSGVNPYRCDYFKWDQKIVLKKKQ